MPFVVFTLRQPADHESRRHSIGCGTFVFRWTSQAEVDHLIGLLGKLRLKLQETLPGVLAVHKKAIGLIQNTLLQSSERPPGFNAMKKDHSLGGAQSE